MGPGGVFSLWTFMDAVWGTVWPAYLVLEFANNIMVPARVILREKGWTVVRLSTPDSKQEKRLAMLVIGMVVLETILVLLALVPPQLWTRLLPDTPSASLDGPFPPFIAPVITALLYLTPTAIGFMSRSWQWALVYATIPAWVGLGLFVIAATFKVGAFYLVSVDHVAANVSILELFAALGAIGWLGRTIFHLR